jgi:hypothetical protein
VAAAVQVLLVGLGHLLLLVTAGTENQIQLLV